MTYYYKNGGDENCTSNMVPFFKDLASDQKVTAYIWDNEESSKGGVSHETLVRINNNLSTAKCWKTVIDWDVSVEYTISHPKGDITVSDNKLQDSPSMIRETEVIHWNGTCQPEESSRVKVVRSNCEKLEGHGNINVTLYSFVRIKNSKTFIYRTARSSWKYKLCVIWEGTTKENAEKSEKRYEISVESDVSDICKIDPKYTSASFFEKILDVASISSEKRQLLHMHG